MKKNKHHRGFVASNPQDKYRTDIERENWFADREDAKLQKKIQLLSLILSAIAALAAVAGLIVQIVRP